jgi:Fur family ferric uptake transcriptional regulator
LDCGHVEEFTDDGIEQRQNAVAERHGFAIQDHSLILYGRCNRVNCPRNTNA